MEGVLCQEPNVDPRVTLVESQMYDARHRRGKRLAGRTQDLWVSDRGTS